MSSDLRTVEHRGCRLAYRVSGDGAPVLMIQGVGLHGDGWAPQVEELASEYRCLRFDNRGLGQSQPMGAAITIRQLAEDARVLMDAEGWASAHVVGHSMGGLIALQLALIEPTRVRSLALLCTFARGTEATGFRPDMFGIGLRTYIGTRRMRRRAFLEMVFSTEYLRTVDRDTLAEKLAPIFGHDLADHPPVVMKQLSAVRRCDLAAELPKLSGMPTLVVTGRHDRIARPRAGRAITDGIKEARYVEFPDAAHGLPIQCAAELNQLLRQHFSRTDKM